MTEQDKLREAINSLGSACQKTLVIGPAANRMTRTVWEDDLIRVLAAAEQSLTFRRLPVPGELDDKLLRAMWDAAFDDEPMKREPAMRAAYKALYEHLTKPKTKMVDVWRVEYVKRIPGTADDPCAITYLNRADAERRAAELPDFYCTCVRVTGPHQQEMPT